MRAVDDRNAELARRTQLGVVRLDGRGMHDDIRGVKIRGRVTNGDGNAQAAQPGHALTFAYVGAGHLYGAVVQGVRQRAHADAADADHVRCVDSGKINHWNGCQLRAFCIDCSPMTATWQLPVSPIRTGTWCEAVKKLCSEDQRQGPSSVRQPLLRHRANRGRWQLEPSLRGDPAGRAGG